MGEQPSNQEIIASLAGMLESYHLVHKILKDSKAEMASGVLYGSFAPELHRCQDLINRLKKAGP